MLIHADESCLGNQNEGPSPGGAGALIEFTANGNPTRRDFCLCSASTTNNRMALTGAIELLKLLDESGHVGYCSDSQYLVKGITEWVFNWERRGWKRKGGAVENLELWQELRRVTRHREVAWQWVRGHAGHVKNEYADHLAVRAAADQMASGGLTPSEFGSWLAQQQSRGKFSGYDPDQDLEQLAGDQSTLV
ncbi:MAG: ribonuclease HI [Gemmatimonadetes bacterium]|nr:ribonuclease HI [Gemmatimonadota bacterium]